MATIRALGSLKNAASYRTIQQKLALGVWPWTDGVRARLPRHYKLRYIEKHQSDPTPVHYTPDPAKYKVDKTGQRCEVQNIPVPVYYPAEADQGLWGGEGFLLGLKKKQDKHSKPRVYRLWKPNLQRRAVHSEILDTWLDVTLTLRTLDLIDEAHGLDHYILATTQLDLQSRLGMHLKRKLLLTLLHGPLYPNDPVKRAEVYDKYKQYLVPEEEIPWLGLSLEEAERKQEAQEEADRQAATQPLKQVYMEELIQQMRNNQLDTQTDDSSSWTSKLNPFNRT